MKARVFTLIFIIVCTFVAQARTNKTANISKSLSFVEDKGQIINQDQEPRPDIDFRLSAGNGLNVFIGDGAIHYQWAILRGPQGDMVRQAHHDIARQTQDDQLYQAYDMYRMDVELIGANPDARLIAEGKQNYYERYFQPRINKDNRDQGVIARSYRKITYKNVYPNIDWVLYIKNNTVEYDFVVRPEGKVSDIKLKYGGTTNIGMNTDGSLTARTPMGKITEHAPCSFHQDGKVVGSRFVLKGDTLSFETDRHTGTLTIDPALEWATYFGGLDQETAYDIANDSIGNIYIGGASGSLNNIATSGGYQTSFGGAGTASLMGDAFLSKFNPNGDCLWATYYGGSDEDRGSGVCIEAISGQVYLAGSTKSINGIASIGAYQEINGGNYDAFLVKFDTMGQRIWGTYYGGPDAEGSTFFSIGTASDGQGNVYLAGDCASTSGIASPGSYQSSLSGSKDAFIVKFDSSGQRVWGTYFGGDGNDWERKISCDISGNIYITGYTGSTSGLATTGSYQGSIAGSYDAFLTKFNSTGGLEWSTYFGGTLLDQPLGLIASRDGMVYISGLTLSTSGIATPSSHQPVYGGGYSDVFLAQFDTAGQLNWCTYYGGMSLESAGSLASAPNNDILLTGSTTSADGIATPGSYQDTLNNADAFIACFSPSGQRKWGTYYGGAGAENQYAATVDNAFRLTATGNTNSATSIATPGSYQQSFGGGSKDAFLVQFNICETPQQPVNIAGDTILCSGQAYTFSVDTVSGAISYNWTLPAGWSGNSDSNSITITPDLSSGSIAVAASNVCATSDSTVLDIIVNASPEPEIENNNNVLSTTLPYVSYQWNQDGQPISGATAATYPATEDGSYSVTVTNENGCSGTSDTIELNGVGIGTLQALREAIRIYPNPTEDMVFIQAPVAVKVEVVDIEGRVLKHVAHVKTISLRELSDGFYLMKVYDKEERMVKVEKVVKR